MMYIWVGPLGCPFMGSAPSNCGSMVGMGPTWTKFHYLCSMDHSTSLPFKPHIDDKTGSTMDDDLDSPQHVSNGKTRVNNENVSNGTKTKSNNTDVGKSSGKCANFNILHLYNIPISNNYESINALLCSYGAIREIRMKLMNNK